MDSLAKNILTICWGVFFVTWAVAAIFTKRTVYHESRSQRLRYVVPVIMGWFFVFRAYRLPYPFNVLVIPRTDGVLVVATILCVCGLAICLWARAILGRNWSGTVTLKEGHELIVRGPYKLVRHPIYTGILAMIIATVILQGRIGGIIGLVLVFVSFLIKLSEEEQVMLKQFPDEYAAYRQRTPRIIPFMF
jgi:protein-S-isoprenylcysteine O-methyltransferase Ste14